MKFTHWALGQVQASLPGNAGMVAAAVQDLANAVLALRGKGGGGQIFGMGVSNLEAEGRPELEAAVIRALVEWKHHFEEQSDVVSLLALDKAGRSLDIADLVLTRRFPLRCDPLGARDGLRADWLRRLERLDEAVAGRRAVDAAAVHWVLVNEYPAPAATFGAPDANELYEFALRYEATRKRPFPREMAALWSTANGIALRGDPLLRPVRDWTWEDDGLCIGCGGYMQGSLTIAESSKKDLLDAKVVDRDDDGVVTARYANLGGFVDALLGS